jgi:putative hemolysin
MPAVEFELFVILLLILANGVFAMAEMALVSARKAHLQEWAEAGNTRARAAAQIKPPPARPSWTSACALRRCSAGCWPGGTGRS